MSMKMNHRESKIIEYVNEHGSATVTELSNYTKVSEITIRRDLERLESRKAVIRYHGGAKKNTSLEGKDPIMEFKAKEAKMCDEKKRIGKKAAELIKDGDIVFMNSGTTVLTFLECLEKKNVTVATNNTAALDCQLSSGIDILMLGGNYSCRTRSVEGDFTCNQIMGIYSTCTVLGVNALDLENGMTTSVYQQSMINKSMINHTKCKVILLADSTKMGRISNFVSASLSSIQIIVTDDKCPPAYVEGFREKGIEVFIV